MKTILENPNIKPFELPGIDESDPVYPRVVMTCSCRDCDELDRVEGAGQCFQQGDQVFQLMHNGVKVVRDGYYGNWTTEIIRQLHGHHEPQEEKLFDQMLKHLPAKATMLELGGFWAYYSLWFSHHVDQSTNYVIEPDPNNIEVGKANFALNEFAATFKQGFIGSQSLEQAPFVCESDATERAIPQICVDDFVREKNIDKLDILHADIQGAELDMLHGARWCIENGKIRFIFISTHHHSISGDPLTHQRCLQYLNDVGAHVFAEHTVAESYSGDGLIVASFDPQDRSIEPVEISYNRSGTSYFPEVEYDLAKANAEIEELRAIAFPPPNWIQRQSQKFKENLDVGHWAKRQSNKWKRSVKKRLGMPVG